MGRPANLALPRLRMVRRGAEAGEELEPELPMPPECAADASIFYTCWLCTCHTGVLAGVSMDVPS